MFDSPWDHFFTRRIRCLAVSHTKVTKKVANSRPRGTTNGRRSKAKIHTHFRRCSYELLGFLNRVSSPWDHADGSVLGLLKNPQSGRNSSYQARPWQTQSRRRSLFHLTYRGKSKRWRESKARR